MLSALRILTAAESRPKGPNPPRGSGGDGNAFRGDGATGSPGERQYSGQHESSGADEDLAASRAEHNIKLLDSVSAGTDGRLADAVTDYHQDSIVQTPFSKDSGTHYREVDWEKLVRRSDAAVGPRQIPLQERVSLNDRSNQLQASSSSRYGTRVNPLSDRRGYSLGEVEKESYIDPRRNLDEVAGGRARDVAPESVPVNAAQVEATVLFETTALGAKLRNTHRVGGERVKEMDHFVASVETPRVVTKTPDVAPYVINVAMAGAAPVRITGRPPVQSIDLYVQSKYRSEDGGVPAVVAAYAARFFELISELCREVLLRDPEAVRVFYVATMRADSSCASWSAEDRKIWVNALVFQQGGSFDPTTGKLVDGTLRKRVYLYWTQRLAMEFGKLDQTERRTLGPTGVYDPTVLARLQTLLGSDT